MNDTNDKLKQRELCVACGMCCDGSLFEGMEIADKEIIPILEVQTRKITNHKTIFIKQPCAAWKNSICSVYQERPRNCQTFRCNLLRDCIRGVQEWEKAHLIIIKTRRHIKLIESELVKIPEINNAQGINQRYNEFISLVDTNHDENRKQYSRLLLEYYAFRLLVDQFFHKK